MGLIDWAERGWFPDSAIRLGIRRLVRQRLEEQRALAPDEHTRWLERIRSAPIALVPAEANRQHYEVSPEFFEAVLGPHLKYSSCLWDSETTELGEAERSMLALSAEHAELRDGHRVLDLGCGWGSFSLWVAEHYPASRIMAVSNSKPQREFILGRCRARGLDNLEVVTADINDFVPAGRFDRVVSVEMFEHLRNWPLVLGRIGGWLADDGKLFVHVFCHREHSYPYEDAGDGDWMSRHFFTGGMMPSFDLIDLCSNELAIEERWSLSGEHYQKTSEAWLERMDAHADIGPILESIYGSDFEVWRQRWRMFFMACAELFGYRGGSEWQVAHYRLGKAVSS